MKRYSDSETTRILARAAELSAREALVQRDGSSLEELEHIAVEAGLDVAAVRRAALDVMSDDDGATELARSGLHLCAEVEGALDDVGRQAVLHEVRARFPLVRLQPGGASLVVLESPFGILFSVASSDKQTRLVLDWNHRVAPQIPKKVSFAIAGAAALAFAALGDTLVEAAVLAAGTSVIAAMTAGIVWACRPLDRVIRRRRRASLTRALESVLAVARAHASCDGAGATRGAA